MYIVYCYKNMVILYVLSKPLYSSFIEDKRGYFTCGLISGSSQENYPLRYVDCNLSLTSVD